MGTQIFRASKNTTSSTNILHDASGLPSIKTISKNSSNSLNTFGKKADSTTYARGSHLISFSLPAEWAGLCVVCSKGTKCHTGNRLNKKVSVEVSGHLNASESW